MNPNRYADQAASYLKYLCNVKPNRRTGSPGNRAATSFFADIVSQYGYAVDRTSFDCLDYANRGSSLVAGEEVFEIHTSPYSTGCNVRAELLRISSVEQLEESDCTGKLLLMKGGICAEQLMPKGFVFYNPEHHQRIYALLEEKNPAGIITATSPNPEMVGALYPFPLFVDGDFDIPNAYCKDTVGERIEKLSGSQFNLKIDAQRTPSTACNVIARINPGSSEKIVLTAHIDAYEDTPGASDNASGTVVLMLLAEMLSDYDGARGIEIAALNGEDHYSAGGQMDYLKRYGHELNRISMSINIDDVGFQLGNTAYSVYNCPDMVQQQVEVVFGEYPGIIPGEQWFNGDHMIFVQNGVPSMALTAEKVSELMATITHTPVDTPDILDTHKLVEVATALKSLIPHLSP